MEIKYLRTILGDKRKDKIRNRLLREKSGVKEIKNNIVKSRLNVMAAMSSTWRMTAKKKRDQGKDPEPEWQNRINKILKIEGEVDRNISE